MNGKKEKMLKLKNLKNRPFLLLEVLIALTLVALCLLPLVSPHIMIIKEERNFISVLEADRMANLIFANIVQEMYDHRIPWELLQSSTDKEVTADMLQGINLPQGWPWRPFWRIRPLRSKGEKEKVAYFLYRIEVIFEPLTNDVQPLRFPYSLFVAKTGPLDHSAGG